MFLDSCNPALQSGVIQTWCIAGVRFYAGFDFTVGCEMPSIPAAFAGRSLDLAGSGLGRAPVVPAMGEVIAFPTRLCWSHAPCGRDHNTALIGHGRGREFSFRNRRKDLPCTWGGGKSPPGFSSGGLLTPHDVHGVLAGFLAGVLAGSLQGSFCDVFRELSRTSDSSASKSNPHHQGMPRGHAPSSRASDHSCS